jgi:hypothetical protein
VIDDDERPRRFGRRHSDPALGESLALRSELLLLREENARLKTAPHRGPDVGELLGRARAISHVEADDDAGIADETTRVLIEGLVIRESLLELCQEIERTMVAFQARLGALQPPAVVDGRG